MVVAIIHQIFVLYVTNHGSKMDEPKNLSKYSTNGNLVVWLGGLGFESGYPQVAIPFIFADPRNPKPPIYH